MIRHIELVKLNEIHDGKNRAEQIEELASLVKDMLDNVEGISAYEIDAKSESHDPVDADMYLQIDFDDPEALDEYALNIDHLAVSIKVAEHAESILEYDLEI